MLAVTAACLCCCLLCLMSVTAVYRETITAAPSETAILSCRVPSSGPITVVEWTREDLDKQNVLFFRDGRCEADYQHPLFLDRVELLDKKTEDRDVSLVLKNVKKEDNGTYECRAVWNGGNRRKRYILDSDPISVINLTVDSPVSQQPLVVVEEEGVESVLLPCQVPTLKHKNRHVEWSRPDLNPSIIHLQREEGDDLRSQNQKYGNRTSMLSKALEDGDLSLTLRKPSVHDTGTYTCSFFCFGHKVRQSEVQVEVKSEVHSGGVPTWATVLLVLLGLLVLGGAVIGGVLCYRRSNTNTVFKVKVDSGKESVQLPCKINVPLTKNYRVVWTTKEFYLVHVYENGIDHPEEQHRNYTGRTQIKKDFSLTLNKPMWNDSNIYTCVVYEKKGSILRTHRVNLEVGDPQEVDSGVESVQLSCQTSVDLTGDVRVEWTDRYNNKVHVYKNGSDEEEQHRDYKGRTEMKKDLQTGDVSLILKHPTCEDSESYLCTIYRGENILMERERILKVREFRKVVKEGEKSVVLPFKTTPDLPEDTEVEWYHDDPKRKLIVHLYPNSADQPDKQDQLYEGRTEMTADTKTGDFSLTLKNLGVKDSGEYKCEVVSKERNIRRFTRIVIEVEETSQDQEDIKSDCSSPEQTPLLTESSG
ncbi:butyrophilin-like protein 2 isoform 2-T2 [Pholidichthys leucotaenia]